MKASIINIIGVGLSLLLQIIIARFLGVEEYGIYSYVFAWVALLSLFAQIGFDISLLRFIPKYTSKSQFSHLRGILTTGFTYSTAASIASGILLFISAYFMDIGSELKIAFYIGSLLIPLYAIISLNEAVLRGLKLVTRAVTPKIILQPLIIIIFIYLFAVNTAHKTLLILLVSASIIVFIGCSLIYKHLPDSVFSTSAVKERRYWLKASMAILFISVTTAVINKVDTIMLGILLNTTQAGIFSIASRISGFVIFGSGAVNILRVPLMSELYSKGEMNNLQQITTLATRAVTFFAIPIVLICIMGGTHILALFGTEFISGHNALIILSLGYLVKAITSSAGLLLIMTGKEKKTAVVMAGSGVLNIIANWYFIPLFGIQGAALATTISITSYSTILSIIAYKSIGINTTIFKRKLY